MSRWNKPTVELIIRKQFDFQDIKGAVWDEDYQEGKTSLLTTAEFLTSIENNGEKHVLLFMEFLNEEIPKWQEPTIELLNQIINTKQSTILDYIKKQLKKERRTIENIGGLNMQILEQLFSIFNKINIDINYEDGTEENISIRKQVKDQAYDHYIIKKYFDYDCIEEIECLSQPEILKTYFELIKNLIDDKFDIEITIHENKTLLITATDTKEED